MLDTVVENNDLYVTTALYTDCSGNYTPTGPCAASESVISTKTQATAGNHTKYLHNRVWGTRKTDLNLCCNGASGQAIGNYDDNPYILFLNNIIMDAQIGINNTAANNSFIGNLFYLIRNFNPASSGSKAINRWNATGGSHEAVEIYLNTLIFAGEENSIPANDSNADTRCNVFFDSGPRHPGTPDASAIADRNTFYNTPSFSFNGSNANIDKRLNLRASNTAYRLGDIIRLSGNPVKNCTASNDPDCFLYAVTAPGTSAGVVPDYCTTLGCTTIDGTMTLTAVRGPYTFMRKLKTGPEQIVVPYARPHSTTPEAFACPEDYASRRNIGIGN
jgi:hypothetical protein